MSYSKPAANESSAGRPAHTEQTHNIEPVVSVPADPGRAPVALPKTVGGKCAAAEPERMLLKDAKFIVVLTDEERAAIELAARALASYHYDAEPERFALEGRVQAALLPERLRRRLLKFVRFSNSAGGLLIRNVPIGDIPPTPATADNAIARDVFGAAAMAVVSAAMGELCGFKPEMGGEIIQSIVPEPRGEDEDVQLSVGSVFDLYDHVEMCFTEHRADYVVLCCLRADPDRTAATTLASVDNMLARLNPRTIAILREPRFRTTVDSSFLVGWGLDAKTKLWVDPICVVEGSEERPRLRVEFLETEAKDPEAASALAALLEAEQAARAYVYLMPGDLLITDNASMHGRTPFIPRYDGADRWLLRTFITRDLSRSATARPGDGRVVDPDYRAWLSPGA